MEKYLEPSKEEIVMAFVASCVESVADGLDFGQGFYLTDIYDQAYNFAIAKSRERRGLPLINVYLLDRKAILEESRSLIFDRYDEDWLDFIVECRSGGNVWKDYDYIEGGVADDRVIDTVNMYSSGKSVLF